MGKWTLALQDNTGRQHLPNPESVVSPVFFERDGESCEKQGTGEEALLLVLAHVLLLYRHTRFSHNPAYITSPNLNSPVRRQPPPSRAVELSRPKPHVTDTHTRLCHVASSNQQRYNQCKHSTPNPAEHFSLPGRRRRRCRPPTRPINLHTGSLGPHGGARAGRKPRSVTHVRV